MKSHRSLLCVVLMALSTVAFAQSNAQKSGEKATPSEAQKAFEKMKALAGSWEGPVTTDLPEASAAMGNKPIQVSLRTTSRGNALMHEMTSEGSQDDPITMFYLDSDRLLLTHYCDAGNRPRMVGKMSPDGKKVEFEFLDISGASLHEHMDHAVFTILDSNHHTEDWTFMIGDKPVQAHFDLKRKSDGTVSQAR